MFSKVCHELAFICVQPKLKPFLTLRKEANAVSNMFGRTRAGSVTRAVHCLIPPNTWKQWSDRCMYIWIAYPSESQISCYSNANTYITGDGEGYAVEGSHIKNNVTD